jgi:carbon storage regulator
MLVLSRHVNEEILIADNIRIVIVRLKGSIVRIGIEAPADITVRRAELSDITANQHEPVGS